MKKKKKKVIKEDVAEPIAERKWDALIADLPLAARSPDSFVHTKSSYAVKVPGAQSSIGVWLGRRTFYVYEVQIPAKGWVLPVNKQGGMSVGFKKMGTIAESWEAAVFAATKISYAD